MELLSLEWLFDLFLFSNKVPDSLYSVWLVILWKWISRFLIVNFVFASFLGWQ